MSEWIELGNHPADAIRKEDVKDILGRVMMNDFLRADMQDTPKRWAKMMRELTTAEEFEFTTFEADGPQEMVIVTDIPYASICAHHLIPFFGKCHIAYIPRRKLAGLSKLPRTVKYFMRRPQVQEELTSQIADYLDFHLEPRGVAVVMKGEHLCMSLRGVQTPGTLTITSAMRGVFLDNGNNARSEFLNLIPR